MKKQECEFIKVYSEDGKCYKSNINKETDKKLFENIIDKNEFVVDNLNNTFQRILILSAIFHECNVLFINHPLITLGELLYITVISDYELISNCLSNNIHNDLRGRRFYKFIKRGEIDND